MEINLRQIIAEQRDEIPLVESIGWVPREQEKAIVTRDIIYRYNIRHVRTFRELAIWLTANYAFMASAV
jgi:hypothetical protein